MSDKTGWTCSNAEHKTDECPGPLSCGMYPVKTIPFLCGTNSGKSDGTGDMNKATELEWLKWFYQNADFGPADSDVREGLKQCFVDSKKLGLPNGYELEGN